MRCIFADTRQDDRGSALPIISCEDALSVVHDFLDGELPGVSRKQMKAHSDACQRCYPHLHLEQVFREAIHRAGTEQHAPAGLKVKLMELLAEADT